MTNTDREILLTIIIPHYNSPFLLNKLIASIPMSKEIQIIIVDDNSTKECEELSNVMENNCHCEFYVNDSGVQSAGACRNIGLKHAKGEWVLFSDADDYFLDDFYDVIRQYVDGSPDIVFFVPTSIDLATKEESVRHVFYKGLIMNYLENPSIESEIQLRYQYFSPCSKIIRRKMICENEIFFDEVMWSNDVMFSIKTGYLAKTIQACEQQIYCITAGTNTLITNKSKETFRVRTRVFVNKYVYLRKQLDHKQFRQLNLYGKDIMVSCIQNHYGFAFLMEMFWLMTRNRILFVKWNFGGILKSFSTFIRLLFHKKKPK